ncbi:NADPH:quinone oxidoreductase family protein [Aquihabitans sp. McL0605]|uniref:NADPH:quinone oxidoreductase family protein n=1 Tax=Aquihabitans sp. McL0605 TaxID=3415671 RepID=UPI003CF3052E
MRAAVCSSYGGPDQVSVAEIDPPPLGPGQARIAVRAAAVNYPDVLVMADKYQISVPLPFVPGSEMAGTIIEVADDVQGLAVGDLAIGTAIAGGFAEEVVLGASAVIRLPPGADLQRAAAFGVAHRTAYHVLRSVARVQPGEELVVLGAGGGVGLAAVQLGALLGATVTAVASSAEKLAVAQELGATRVLDHRGADVRSALKELVPGGTDVVVDPVGGALAEPALRSLHYGGRFVTVGYASGEVPRIPLNLVLLKGIEIVGFQFIDFVGHHTDEWTRNEAELLDLFVSGRATPHIGATFPLDRVAEALQLVADGGAIGKVVIDLGT